MADLLTKYAEKFDENFPIFLVMGMSDEEIDNQIEKSIKANKPYKPEVNDDYDY